jgi:hypothetical protein
MHGAVEKFTQFWLENLGRDRPLGRPRRRWEDNTRMDRREIRLKVVDWIRLAQDRDQWLALVNTVLTFRVT